MAMTRDELVKLGYQIVNFEGFDEEHTRLLNLFSENVPHPNGSNLFYYPEILMHAGMIYLNIPLRLKK